MLTPAAMLGGCTENDDPQQEPAVGRAAETEPDIGEPPPTGDPGPVHVHALGVNPADGALFIATHTGLFRERRLGAKAIRVADRWQDTMGFTVIGPDRFLASGHPDGRENLPPFLGLVESTDAGRTWNEVSLQGEMDFHVLEAAGRRLYGFGSDWETRNQRLLVSDDRGRSWDERPAPEPIADLAVDPNDASRAVASARHTLYLTGDAGRSWRALPGNGGLLVWTKDGLYRADRKGGIHAAQDPEKGWKAVGRVRGRPAALATANGGRLYLAVHDGSIWRSDDGGASWGTGTPSAGEDDRDGSIPPPVYTE